MVAWALLRQFIGFATMIQLVSNPHSHSVITRVPARTSDAGEAVAIARAELELVRAQCAAAMDAARDAAAREATARRELARLREQFQDIVDKQTLQLLELTRELAAPSPATATTTPAPAREGSDGQLTFDAIDAVLASSPL